MWTATSLLPSWQQTSGGWSSCAAGWGPGSGARGCGDGIAAAAAGHGRACVCGWTMLTDSTLCHAPCAVKQAVNLFRQTRTELARLFPPLRRSRCCASVATNVRLASHSRSPLFAILGASSLAARRVAARFARASLLRPICSSTPASTLFARAITRRLLPPPAPHILLCLACRCLLLCFRLAQTPPQPPTLQRCRAGPALRLLRPRLTLRRCLLRLLSMLRLLPLLRPALQLPLKLAVLPPDHGVQVAAAGRVGAPQPHACAVGRASKECESANRKSGGPYGIRRQA